MIAFRRLVLLFSTLAVAAVAAPLERDLGQGLGYVRVKRLPADLPAPPAGKIPPCVIDVRYVEADATAVTTFAAWLRFRASPRAPVFVIANAATSPALLEAIAPRVAGDGVIVIGAAGGRFRPDSAVKITPEEERKAYDALENGADVATLLADNPDKVRNDEASLVRGQTGAAPADLPEESAAAAPRRPTPTVDAALQRALHLHRALVALKML
ncbi:MAG: hypothetical protein JNK23_15705 [Opitutaceae bacterium]|nr:hypothetical protein [Opitutaceae bacterium]